MVSFTHSTGQYLKAGDATLYFEEVGDPTGKPLVLLHGGLGSLSDFNTILGKLPDQYRFIGIDFRGHGKSTLGSEPLTYLQYQADVEHVLKHLNINSYALLGFSDGGIVGYRIASRATTEVEALVTVGAQFRLNQDDPVFEMLNGLTAEMWIEMFPESVEYYQSVNPSPNFSALVQAVVALWTDRNATGYPNDEITRITAPTLIVRGDGDHLLSLNEATELRDKIGGGSLLNVPFSGHEVYKDAPEIFLIALNEFLLNPRKLRLEA